jgi:hypothetical protein
MSYKGQLGELSVSASSAFIVRFEDGQTLDFPSLEAAYSFVSLFVRSNSGRNRTPPPVYYLQDQIWHEAPPPESSS